MPAGANARKPRQRERIARRDISTPHVSFCRVPIRVGGSGHPLFKREYSLIQVRAQHERVRMAYKPIICLDFDGVIHSYTSGWKGAAVIPDPPVDGALDFIVGATKEFRVAIFSSRSKSLLGRRAMKAYLYRHLVDWEWQSAEDRWHEMLGVPAEWSPFTHGNIDDVHRECARRTVKTLLWPWFKPSALITIDDRALTFDGEWPSLESIKTFKPWNKK